MDFSVLLIPLGFMLICAGVMMLLMSLKKNKRSDDIRRMEFGMIFLGPIPIVFGGSKRIVVIGLVLVALIAALLFIGFTNPQLIGW